MVRILGGRAMLKSIGVVKNDFLLFAEARWTNQNETQ